MMPTIALYVTEKQYKSLVVLSIHEGKDVTELLQLWVKEKLTEEGVTE